MAKHPLWSDEYWLLLMQLYLKKPVGVKPLYSRGIVDLSLDLHIPPEFLHAQMFKLRMITPRIGRLWEKYGKSPKKLARGVELLRRMKGYGNADAFYQGVEMNESFEKDWKPIAPGAELTPVKLILILDLYFQLTPITMVPETPEVNDLAKLIKVSPKLIAEVMEVYQFCDPYLNRAVSGGVEPLRQRQPRKALPTCFATERILEINQAYRHRPATHHSQTGVNTHSHGSEISSNTGSETTTLTTALGPTDAASEVVGNAPDRT